MTSQRSIKSGSFGDDNQGVNPRLSIIMAAYDAAPYVSAAVESVLTQTYHDFELVVVDDASTDGTWDQLAALQARDDRIRLFRNDENRGIALTLNRGIDLSRGELLGRMDADDVADDDRFARQVAFLDENPDVSVVGSFAFHINTAGDVVGLSETGPTSRAEFESLRGAGEHVLVFGGSAVFSRTMFDKTDGYSEEFVSAEELDLFDQMAEYGPILAIPEPLLRYRMHVGSTVMRTFYEGRRVHRFIKARSVARLHGEPAQTFEKFSAAEEALPWFRRTTLTMGDRSRYLYRRAGIAFGEGAPFEGARLLAGATVMDPAYVGKRLWAQRLSPRARASRLAASSGSEG